ncbi:Uncharacterised protein [BD1-7 clade bacterium]|uniref:Transposase IS200-like domain-containing protein n=1 Tax=BD1-7 clade bacterium TaxID=2029982 RepID=A0A5S9Q323_9GAMM|nr:Uncharacterised protein [BD1-7 clade bacterium]CAA0112016.1 Uncharacterised protein [BD1-7 clade bacterium]
MTRAREQQISLDATPYYHCVSRCVRRAFLCGGEYEHRREWVEDKMLELARVFCLDIAAYAVMSNHYHVVLYIDADTANALTDYEVVDRWHLLFKGNVLSHRFIKGESLTEAEKTAVSEMANEWRQRLMSISWFMRILNESIARQANSEDGCTGRFWEGRFKSQALVDEKALAACMAYVDLNPVRAGMAKTPEESTYTSIQKRLLSDINHKKDKALQPFVGSKGAQSEQGLPFDWVDYLQLVDWTGRQIRDDKRGYISGQMPDILIRLDIKPDKWLVATQHFEVRFKRLVGSAEYIRSIARSMSIKRVGGMQNCRSVFG